MLCQGTKRYMVNKQVAFFGGAKLLMTFLFVFNHLPIKRDAFII